LEPNGYASDLGSDEPAPSRRRSVRWRLSLSVISPPPGEPRADGYERSTGFDRWRQRFNSNGTTVAPDGFGSTVAGPAAHIPACPEPTDQFPSAWYLSSTCRGRRSALSSLAWSIKPAISSHLRSMLFVVMLSVPARGRHLGSDRLTKPLWPDRSSSQAWTPTCSPLRGREGPQRCRGPSLPRRVT
jgi:hypothetical protein